MRAGLFGTDWALPVAPRGRAHPWAEIEHLAAAMAAREPAQRQLVDETGLLDAPPAAIVSAVVSRRLGRVDGTPVATLRALVLDALSDEPAVLERVEADLRAVVARDPACRSSLHALLHLKGVLSQQQVLNTAAPDVGRWCFQQRCNHVRRRISFTQAVYAVVGRDSNDCRF